MKTHLLSYLARYLTIWLFLTSGMGALGQSKLLYPLEFGSEGIRLTTLSNLGLGSSSEVTFDTLNLGTDLNVQGSAIFTTATFSSNISVSGSASFHGDVSILDGISISDAGARRSLRDSLEVSGTLYVSNLTSGSSALKSVTTTDKAVDRIYLVKTAGVFYVFALEASTHEEEGINWIRPNDYNASTNAKVWRRLALFTPFLNVTDDLTIGGNVTISNAGAREDLREAIGAASIAALEQRERSGYLVSDGTTANRAAGIWRFGADGDVAGQAITIPFEFDVPTSNPSGNAFIAKFASSVSSEFENNGLTLRISTAGNLVLLATGATYASDQRVFNYPSWRAAYSGQHVRGVAIVNPGTSTPVIVINGVDISGSFSATTTGTAPNWMDESLSTTYYLAGHNWPAGRFWPHAPILGAVSVNDAIEWTRGGDWPSWCHSPGRGGNILAGWDFTVGWTEGGSSTITGANTFTSTGAGGPALATALTPGRYYIVKVEGSATSEFTVRSGTAAPTLFTIGGFGTHLFRATSPVLYLRNSSAGSTTITSLELYAIGSLAEPIVQPILALDDRLNRYGARVLGFTPVTFGDSRWRVIGNTATSGNEQILGGPVFSDYESVVIDDVVMTCSNSNTVTLGSSSGGAQYKASGALVPGTNVISLVTRLPASTSFWVGSDSNYPIRTWITGHMAGMHVDIP